MSDLLTRRQSLQGLALWVGGGLAATPAWAGESVPALSLPKADGSVVPLLSPTSKLTYVDFWASWCGPCRQSFPWMNKLHQRFKDKGLSIVAVNLDAKRADADRFLAEMPAQFTVLFDATGRSAREFQVKGMPSSMLVNAQRELVWRHTGFKESDAAGIETRLAQALGLA
ncbi:TlpA family protein disulfide reductase [Ideonella paludis]|uniref:TlpA family protein disulfide reductase n=1 Tax=Ideonella paludis TaxID=1233411 RepID=A0ABS5DWZ4_9BURK|nr:TlpA disulfide reductase family protein [Ideonella paludis]MBQ0935656.1 TlpA family protein disulfide reductase [Ideonella paludis]